jgi:hypothetical protein
MSAARLYTAVQAVRPTRLVAASFAAGAGMMMLFALVAPVIAKGGLTVREADAQTIQHVAPAIDPLDLNAIQAELDAAERAMAASQRATDAAVARLQSLAGE